MRNSGIRWEFPELIHVPGDFQLKIGGSALVSQTLYHRGYTTPDDALGFLDPNHYKPCPPTDLPGMTAASERIINAITDRERILIWGDFDVDGQTSTALLVSSLQKLGASVNHHIPIRSEESHGISLPVLTDLIAAHSPQLIITCDTGIDANEEIEFANNSGVDVIITDHHQLTPTLPNALAIINPNLLPTEHALRNLPGVGVAFKLIEEIYSHFGQDPSYLLDLVALGIVADVAVQSGDTRYLLQKGLYTLRNSSRSGLSVIYKSNNINPKQINEDHIGFVIGPRLNALGRLGDANSCVEFFTTNNPGRAYALADRLESLNQTRQLLTDKIYHDAENMISAYPELVEDYPILVLQGSPQWHPGVIGIVASRLVERYRKPVIMLSQDGDQARGSARSIPGVHISDLISTAEDLLISHGGHPMAAGLALPLNNVTNFRRVLAENYIKLIGDTLPEDRILIDAEISFRDISESFIIDFQRLAPFGAGNPKLTFATRGVITDKSQIKIIGKSGNHRKISFSDPNNDQNEFLWWNSINLPIPENPLDIAYTLELSTYRDQLQIQSTLLHLRTSPATPVYIPARSPIDHIDLRKHEKPLIEIDDFYSSSESIIWAENQKPKGLPSFPRSELSKHATLILWTTPPSKLVLNQVIKKVSPNQIVFVGINPEINSLDQFVQALLGLIKHLKKTEKPFNPIQFSEALALPVDVIEVGVEWLHQQGDYNLDQINKGFVGSGPGKNLPNFEFVDEKLKHMLREVLAYRSYFRNAPIRALL
jgi:single-stranded-DNA-specific exonuclease